MSLFFRGILSINVQSVSTLLSVKIHGFHLSENRDLTWNRRRPIANNERVTKWVWPKEYLNQSEGECVKVEVLWHILLWLSDLNKKTYAPQGSNHEPRIRVGYFLSLLFYFIEPSGTFSPRYERVFMEKSEQWFLDSVSFFISLSLFLWYWEP